MGSQVRATPAWRSRSIRRTTSHDLLRPEGLQAPVTLMAVGPDLRTDEHAALLDRLVFDESA